MNQRSRMMSPTKILIQTNLTYEFVQVDSIVSLQSEQGMTKVILDNNQEILSSDTFSSLLNQLRLHPIFRCHKSYAINVTKVIRYHKDGMVVLDNNSEIPVARRRVNELIQVMKDLNNVLE